MSSSSLCRRRSTCRLCDSAELKQVLSLTPTPPANAFLAADALERESPKFPLDLFLCRACGHLQLLDAVDPRLLFENYVYVSGTSPVFIEHFRRYAAAMLERLGAPSGARVVEIGSNDGTLLRFFAEAGAPVLGVDPARRIAEEATKAGIETLPAFFTSELGAEIARTRGQASLVLANNVFAHADDLSDILTGVRSLLRPDGLFAFEVSYLVDVYEKTLFDTIYHEHVSYHTVGPLVGFFERHGMELIEAIRVDTHGGSLRGIAQLRGGPRRGDGSVERLRRLEEDLGLFKPETFAEFAARIDLAKRELRKLLRELKAAGKTIAGFGAPAKATTLMLHFELGRDVLDFIVDDNPLKQGLFSPGLHIPVVASTAIDDRKPDYLLLLAWNFAGPIMQKHRAFAERGGRFIVPLPELSVQ